MKEYELLRKQADMMEMAEKYGVDDWRKLVRVRCIGDKWLTLQSIEFYKAKDTQHKFALGVVEGKPVFEDDELFSPKTNDFIMNYGKRKLIARGVGKSFSMTGEGIMEGTILMDDGGVFQLSALSWNPPAPKTVMVELLLEDAEWFSRQANERCAKIYAVDRAGLACRKALGEKK